MDDAEIERFRKQLSQMLKALSIGEDLGRDATRTVTLDQQAVGRLSRMDALQQQAMAKAQSARRAQSLTRIQVALARIDNGEVGYCLDCGGAISAKRLGLDPAVPKCISCARG